MSSIDTYLRLANFFYSEIVPHLNLSELLKKDVEESKQQLEKTPEEKYKNFYDTLQIYEKMDSAMRQNSNWGARFPIGLKQMSDEANNDEKELSGEEFTNYCLMTVKLLSVLGLSEIMTALRLTAEQDVIAKLSDVKTALIDFDHKIPNEKKEKLGKYLLFFLQ